MNRVTTFFILLGLVAAPVLIGSAGTTSKTDAAASVDSVSKNEKTTVVAPKAKVKSECLASEEIIQDLEERESNLKKKEAELAEREQDLDAQTKAVKEDLAKLDANRVELQGIHGKELAEREEKVNKLIETFESMSPKTAAQVIGNVDDELAVTALSRLSSTKAGKILGNLPAEKSSKLSEMMAYGKKPAATVATAGKEKANGESSNRAPASR